MNNPDEPIEDYLDHLLLSAPGTPREVRRTLAEVEDHLVALAEAGRAQGLSAEQADREAVRRLGPIPGVLDRPSWLRPPRVVRRRLVLAGLFLLGWGGLAVGLAGVIALVVKTIWGPGAIATGFPVGAYSSADCTRWQHAYPQAGNCTAAMVADHADDFLRNAGVALFAGAIALLVRAALVRRWLIPARLGLDAAIGAGLALLAMLGWAAVGFDAITVTNGEGAGQPIALAIAAGLACLGLTSVALKAAGRPLLGKRPAGMRGLPS